MGTFCFIFAMCKITRQFAADFPHQSIIGGEVWLVPEVGIVHIDGFVAIVEIFAGVVGSNDNCLGVILLDAKARASLLTAARSRWEMV